MSPSPFAVYDAVVALAGHPTHEPLVHALQEIFFTRTGAFSSDDPWFERRTRAFWDDALTRGGLATRLAPELSADEARVARTFARAHRGLFSIEPEDERVRFHDLVSDAVFWVESFDFASKAGIFHHEGGLCDARLVASDEAVVAMLPGAFFHPDDATPSVRLVLEEAKARGMDTQTTLDALLTMELRLCTLSRVKASFAYRLSSPTSAAPRPSS